MTKTKKKARITDILLRLQKKNLTQSQRKEKILAVRNTLADEEKKYISKDDCLAYEL